MMGVILWKNTNDGSAVIWCEDHGDLAYFDRPPDAMDAPWTLQAGDLVTFQLDAGSGIRRCRHLRFVDAHQYPGLAEELLSAGQKDAAAPPVIGQGGKVIDLNAERRAAQKRSPFGRRPDGTA